MTGFPTNPKGAFVQAGYMADKLGLSLIGLCELAGQTPSTVYRWKTNSRSYDVSVYAALEAKYDSEVAARKKRRQAKKRIRA